jgi:3-oxoacyl-[acyl-carrier protein] reductase
MERNTSGITIDLTNKTVLITGGTRGIGKSIGDRFIEAGAHVILTGTNQEEIDKLNGLGKAMNINYMQLDLSNDESVSAFIEKILSLDKIDVLINNAGINKIALNTETTMDDFNLISDVNLKGPYLLSREVSKIMKKNKYGRIVNVTSIWSSVTRSGRSIYTTTKWGVVGLTKTLSVELAPYNILVNAVGPGFTLTELTASTNTKEEIDAIAQIIPMKRFAEPSEIANLILFLGSDLNTYLTGQNVIIDGGYTNV